MSKLKKEFIVDLKGKEFVTYEGLLDVAHQMKLHSIHTELIQIPSKENNNTCIVKATAMTEDDKTFEGYGDADPSNVNRLIAKHSIRMAETRAKARALRDLTNIGMTAFEELAEDEDELPKQYTKQTNKLNNNLISGKQRKRMFAISNGNENLVKEAIKKFGFKSTAEVTRDKYDQICKCIEEKELPEVFKQS